VQERFLREGRSQFILRHPNIVRSSDFITQDNRHFLVMDYIEGRSLYTLAMDEGPLDAARVVRLALPLLDALAHAHDKGIVHRDVKLHNILLGENDKPYLTDFGIAKALRPLGGGAPSGRRSTSAGTCWINGMHKSGQIQRPADVDGRSDIYSFGCVLYDLLTGQPRSSPMTETTAISRFSGGIVFEPPKLFAPAESNIPEAIEAVVLRALEKDRNKRFATCREMARAGRTAYAPAQCRRGHRNHSGPVLPGLDTSPPDSAKSAADPAATRAWRHADANTPLRRLRGSIRRGMVILPLHNLLNLQKSRRPQSRTDDGSLQLL
jgi:serine/threonine-protein kinase